MTQSPRPASPEDQKLRIRRISELVQAAFSETHQAREQALTLSRQVTRNSANSIRATHRGELVQAKELLNRSAELLREIEHALKGHPAVYYVGFVEDGQKEYAEASATLAFVEGTPLAGPDELNVGPAPYMNGLGEAVGELRRFILDSLRREDFGRSEELLDLMDEVYTVLVSMDFPDGVTRGLRRTADMVRGVLERTRGDLTMALRQRRLEQQLESLHAEQERPAGPHTGAP